MGAGAFIFNTKGELLIVKPNYKEYWLIPGGTVDENESPRAACLREVKEEIGLDLPKIIFIAVDYTPAVGEKNEALQFSFYGGVLDDMQINSIKLQASELDAYKFVSVQEAFDLLGGLNRNLGKRLSKCVEVIKTGTAVYLEDGEF